MAAYALATFWGWHLGPRLQQRPWVRSQLLLLTCGIWLELVFFDLLPSTQPTLMGILGFRMATLFSLILFFSRLRCHTHCLNLTSQGSCPHLGMACCL